MVLFSASAAAAAAAAGSGYYYLAGSGIAFMSAWLSGIMEGKVLCTVAYFPIQNLSIIRYGNVSIPYTLLGQNVPLSCSPSTTIIASSETPPPTTMNSHHPSNISNETNNTQNQRNTTTTTTTTNTTTKDNYKRRSSHDHHPSTKDSEDLRNQYQWNRRRSLKLSRTTTTTNASSPTANNRITNHISRPIKVQPFTNHNSNNNPHPTSWNMVKIQRIQDSFRHIRVICLTGSVAFMAAHIIWKQTTNNNNSKVDEPWNHHDTKRIIISPPPDEPSQHCCWNGHELKNNDNCNKHNETTTINSPLVIPFEIVNHDAFGKYCQRMISSKIRWNQLQYQSKFPKSKIVPIYYHSHLYNNNNNNNNHYNIINNDAMICISCWQLVSNMLHQIMKKKYDPSYITTFESPASSIETMDTPYSEPQDDNNSKRSYDDEEPTRSNHHDYHEENIESRKHATIDANTQSYATDTTATASDDDLILVKKNDDNPWKGNTISSSINYMFVGIGKHIRLTWNSYWNKLLFLTQIRIQNEKKTEKNGKRQKLIFIGPPPPSSYSHSINNSSNNRNDKTDFIYTIQSFFEQQHQQQRTVKMEQNGTNNFNSMYPSSIVTMDKDYKIMWSHILKQVKDENIDFYCVVMGNSDDETCIMSSKILEDVKEFMSQSITKIVIIPIFEHCSNATNFQEFLQCHVTQSNNITDDDDHNTYSQSIVEYICLEDIQEQAFQQTRLLLSSLETEIDSEDKNKEESFSTLLKTIGFELTLFTASSKLLPYYQRYPERRDAREELPTKE